MTPAPLTSTCSRAFTLIELVCAMTVMGVLSVLAGRLLSSVADEYMSASARTELSMELSGALERISTELRLTRLKNISTPDISSLTASSITWNDPTGVKTLSLSGTDLILADSVASSPIARNVTSFGVQAYDESNVALPAAPTALQLASARRVQITITAQRQGVSETLRTRVFLRMLMSGGGM